MTRRHWPDGPAWARHDAAPSPSWLARGELAGITKRKELEALLAPMRG
jgi:hypothetical protein